MSHSSPETKPTGAVAESSQNNPLMIPNGKSTAAAPKLSDDDHVELKDILPSVPDPDEDIMQLARVGDIPGIEKLYDSGKFDATYCDDEGITPLHVFAPSFISLRGY
jgi:palmitoyltransferase